MSKVSKDFNYFNANVPINMIFKNQSYFYSLIFILLLFIVRLCFHKRRSPGKCWVINFNFPVKITNPISEIVFL